MSSQELLDLFGTGTDIALQAAHVYLAARKAHEEAEESLRAARACLDAAEASLAREMDLVSRKSIQTDEGRLEVQSRTYYSLPAGGLDQQTLFAWLVRSGGHDLVRRTVHHESFSRFCRLLAEQERSIHPAVRQATRRVVRLVEEKT